MLAIVIPYYKLTFFETTLQSLVHQTNKRFKVYIGNDASPESPDILIEKYRSQLDFEYKRFESNVGGISLVKQWERCLSMIGDEEWLMILGDDDVLPEDYVESFYQNIEKAKANDSDVIRFATIVIDGQGKTLSNIYTHPEVESSVDFLFRKLNGGTRSSLSEYVFKSRDVKLIGFKDFPFAWHADDLAVLEFSKFKNIFTINTSVVSFRISHENITGKNDNLKLKNEATFRYYCFLLGDGKKFFSNDQQQILFSKLEKSFSNDKKNRYFWVQLIKIYFKNRAFKRFFKLLLKSAKSLKINN